MLGIDAVFIGGVGLLVSLIAARFTKRAEDPDEPVAVG